ncbi:MAG: hypothetical protein P9X22_09690 [Candidatus Zapsychrus exili]|nr:hypothetical protein [Candidatus Zapsychrus exili]
MDIEKFWNKALKNTEIIRSRIQALGVNSETHVPYILLSESTINIGDTIVRKGEVVVEKPSLIVPPHNPQFEGFDFDAEDTVNQNSLINFLLVRGVSIPSLRYDNKTHSLDVFEGKLSAAIKSYKEDLNKQENVKSGLIAGPEDCWQFSLLIFICSQIARNADNDIRKLLEKHKQGEQ